jgi:hypothetical protein
MYWAGLRPKTDIPRASNSKQAYTFHWATPGLHTLALTGHNLQVFNQLPIAAQLVLPSSKKKQLFFFLSKTAAADPENRESPATFLLTQHAVQSVSSGGHL